MYSINRIVIIMAYYSHYGYRWLNCAFPWFMEWCIRVDLNVCWHCWHVYSSKSIQIFTMIIRQRSKSWAATELNQFPEIVRCQQQRARRYSRTEMRSYAWYWTIWPQTSNASLIQNVLCAFRNKCPAIRVDHLIIMTGIPIQRKTNCINWNGT